MNPTEQHPAIRTVRYVSNGALALATCELGLVYSVVGLWFGAVMVVALGLLWWWGDQRGWHQMTTIEAAGFVCAAVIALWLQLPPLWVFLGMLLTLAAWDLQHFALRLRSVQHVDGANLLVRAHLQFLLVVLFVGAVVGAVALGINIRPGFGWTLLLGMIALFGLGYAIAVMRRTND